MAVTKKYTEQIVVMTTPDQAGETRGIADEFGVSIAQAARDAMALGLPRLREQYKKLGIVKPPAGAPTQVPYVRPAAPASVTGARVKARIKSREVEKIPPAVFSAPVSQ